MSDDFDDIFGDFDPTADLDELDWNNPDGPLPLNKSNTKKDASGATGKGTGLEGVDDEVKIAKRKPRAKLDADRLLAPNGLIRVAKEAPKKLKFKGKGHEYKDCARLLAFYQLWADDLFPKAKFRDSLAMIEKLGHSKRVQMTRAEFIDADKRAKDKAEDEKREKEEAAQAGETQVSKPPTAQKPTNPADEFPDDMDMDDIFGAPPRRSSPPVEGDLFDDFDAEFAAAFAERDEEKAREREAQRQKNIADMEARKKQNQENQLPTSTSVNGSKSTLDPSFDEDELFATPASKSTAAVMSGALPSSAPKQTAPQPNKATEEDEFPDEMDFEGYEPNEDELEMLMALP